MNKFVGLLPIISIILGMPLLIISGINLKECKELSPGHIPFCLSLLGMGLSLAIVLIINAGDDLSGNE